MKSTLFQVFFSLHLNSPSRIRQSKQDLCELTVILLVSRENITRGSAGNRIWSSDQASGRPKEEDLESSRLLAELVLRDRFDTLFLLDREAKHEALRLIIEDI